MQDDLLSPVQVAELLQLDVETVRVWLREGKLPGVRVGRQWRVRRGDLNKDFDRALRTGSGMAGGKPVVAVRRKHRKDGAS